ASEKAALKPLRVRVLTVKPGQTVGSLAAGMVGVDRKLDLFRVINALGPGATVSAGDKAQIIIDRRWLKPLGDDRKGLPDGKTRLLSPCSQGGAELPTGGMRLLPRARERLLLEGSADQVRGLGRRLQSG